ncbi:MAG: endonuclease/exonuclease/phosphatase family protein [Lentisphaeria bacterium]|nr:endonuclease/exonuclease/phosphatase family protein [Lentisphaeria bacterium]
MKKILFSALAAMFLLCGCKSIPQETFTLATFNIRCPVDKTPNTWQERKPRCLAVIRKNQFDIFGVQEAVRSQLDDLLGDEFLFIGGGRDDFKNKGEFSAILYRKDRFELIRGGTFGLSEKPSVPGYKSWKTAYPRIATWGLFRDKRTGKEFIYYNTHLDHVSELARINGIKLLVRHASENAKGKPLIISGDFNAKPTSPTYQTASSLLNDSAKVSLTPHVGPVQTFHGFGRYVRTYPIDFIFVSDEIRVLSHKTDGTKFPEGFPSDHYPVITRLHLK